MHEADAPLTPDRDQTRAGHRHWPVIRGAVGALVVAVMAGVGIWRVELADRLVMREMRTLHLPLRWQLRGVGFDGAMIGRVTIGDAAHPDLSVERAEVKTGAGGISRVTLWGLRLHGRLSHGRISFGSLDALFNTPSAAPFRLPGWELALIDGRAVIDGDAGIIHLAASGNGKLSDGFSGQVEGDAPLLALGGCKATDNALAARITVSANQPHVDGALSSGRVACGGVAYARPRLALTGQLTPALDGGEARLALGPLDGGPVRARALELTGKWRSGPGGRLSGGGTLSGNGIAPGAAILTMLARQGAATRGTPAAPLLASIADTLSRPEGARLSGHWGFRDSKAGVALDVPDLRLTGARGDWLRISRAMLGPAGPSAEFALGGGLPGLSGQISSAGHGPRARLMVAMHSLPFSAGGASVALPLAQMVKAADGSLAIRSALVLSGPLPGGRVDGLSLPLDGGWTEQGGLRLGIACMPVRIGGLVLGGMALRQQAVRLCPSAGALVTVGSGGTSIGGSIAHLALVGRLAGEPFRVTSGPMALSSRPAGQGTLSANGLAISLGTGAGDRNGASRFALGSVSAQLGRSGIDGTFSGADVALGAVPVDLRGGAGHWHWHDGALRLEDAGFQVTDRAVDARFYPLLARGATLELRQGVIHAGATMREPNSDREVARLTLVHDLSASSGRLGFTVPALAFDKGLQPEAITPLTLGIIANASGSLSGEGEIGWADGKLTSHGSFATAGLDFAAAFGPVKGVAGRVVFTDLVGMVTAPGQHVRIASINPGIEVDDGEVSFALLPGRVLVLNGVEWPFIDGRLRLLPTRMVLGASEVRRYELVIEGLNASKFLQYLDLSNIGATGTFDGHLPLVFNGSVGRIEGGLLTARPGGGSVSYVGALSYRDMQPVANYAFRMLRSLKYTDMQVGMEGPLDGDIVTRIQLKGVGQGPGASRNFLTRQIAHVPIQFNVNIRAPFYRMVTSFKTLSDPSLLADPRTLGLLGADGRPLPGKAVIEIAAAPDRSAAPSTNHMPGSDSEASPALPNSAMSTAQPDIQPPVSEHRP